MKFNISKTKDSVVCTFNAPRWDYSNVRESESQILKKIEKAEKVVFDLENVEFIASAFLRLCLEAVKITGKDNFEIINSTEFVSAVLQISRFDNFIKVSSSKH
jgi:anti-anti-sigma factor